MKNIRKKLLIIFGVLITVSAVLNITLYCSFNVFPKQLKVNTIEIKDSHIPSDMDGVSILYFTDLEFGEYQNEERTEKLFDTIYNLHPDVLIFGGDLFDADYNIKDEEYYTMVDHINKIEAPLGKFAVLGDFDTIDERRYSDIIWTYNQTQIELLSDSAVKLTNGTNQGIQLVGLSLTPNYETVVANINNSTYNLVISHKPDLLIDSKLGLTSINLALAGHSHGTQITFPIYGGYQTIEGATELNITKGQNLNFDYLISTGVGCTNIDARLNATPEVYYFILKSKK